MSASPAIRTATALLCVVLVVFAAFVPAGVSNAGVAILTSLWFVVPAAAVTVVRRAAQRADVQPVSLLSLVPFRGPPAPPAL